MTISLAVMSGKGGVGKSGFSVNLGYSLLRSGKRVLLMDCDVGLANLDILLGITPRHNLVDLIQSEMEASEVVVPIEDGLSLLPAATGITDLIEMDEDAREVLVSKLNRCFDDYDYVVLDLPAGAGETVVSLAAMVQRRILLVTPEPTSLTDGYALVKILRKRFQLRDYQVVVNMVESDREAAETFNKLDATCRNFLGIELSRLGEVHHDPAVREAVRRQTPFVKMAPDSPVSIEIAALARKIMDLSDGRPDYSLPGRLWRRCEVESLPVFSVPVQKAR